MLGCRRFDSQACHFSANKLIHFIIQWQYCRFQRGLSTVEDLLTVDNKHYCVGQNLIKLPAVMAADPHRQVDCPEELRYN
mmetsp:Transcript_18754/g.15659  ORF Transcript_18754/g.15659 Transcript_18754/m.15659 type:complete len:80 (+) Transcript_18754:42-281(+)